MAERNGSGDGGDERDRVGSGQQDDRSWVEPGRDVPVEGRAGEENDLSDNDAGTTDAGTRDEDTDATGNEVTAPGDDTVGAGDGAEIITFRRRDDEAFGRDAVDGELPGPEETADPVDLAALQADDELLEVLGGTDPDLSGVSGEHRADLESLLVSWRRDVDAVPMDDIVDTDAAVAAIAQGRSRPRARKRRHLVPVATAAAVLMITFTGVGLAARDAMPGDALWGVTQVLYSDYAESAKAVSQAEEQLETAGTAWENGQRDAAQEALRRARDQMRTVDTASRRLPDLRAAHASLSAKFDEDTTTTATSSPGTTSAPERTSPSESSRRPTGTLPLPPPSGPPSSSEPSTPPSSSPREPSDPTSPPESTSGSEPGASTSSGTSGRSSQDSGILPP